MRVSTKSWLALSAIGLLACGDSGGGGNDETTSRTDAGSTADAGMFCGAQADGTPRDTSAMGGCYYFYCEETKESLLEKSTKGGQCANATDVGIQCEGQSVRTVSECARMKSGTLISGTKAFTDAVTECARGEDSQLSKEFSDGCLECNVQSSLCAAQKCLAECVQGDSVLCDTCREKNKCTPDFYTCAGLPDPNK